MTNQVFGLTLALVLVSPSLGLIFLFLAAFGGIDPDYYAYYFLALFFFGVISSLWRNA